MIALRKQNLSIYDIQEALEEEGINAARRTSPPCSRRRASRGYPGGATRSVRSGSVPKRPRSWTCAS
jgi:hypothetical protein